MNKRWKIATLAVAGALIGGGLGYGAAWAIDNAPAEVTEKYVAEYEGEPISRWFLETDGLTRGSEHVEVGPALYDCFEIGDTYWPGSVGSCEGVVWP